ncbi:hypothetical protein B0T19DRAFT_443260 [Cercophora scortea]|uniref:Uncharacterized protein n=1 Tax=Cercophora scortea TaxID=314031 RepID=A0AAE0IEL3_9PEZI|nr:hypothetical protein B0T19DRAFT_443260 [Cercophora scortea]
MCSNINGANAPFCSPTEGTRLEVGKTIDVTWDPSFFNSTTTPQIRVQAEFSPAKGATGGSDGFTTDAIDVTAGRYTWTILPSYLNHRDHSGPRSAQLFLANPTDTDNDGTFDAQDRVAGPRVEIISSSNTTTSPTSPNDPTNNDMRMMGPNPLSIALPVSLGILVLLLIGGYFLLKRRAQRNNPEAGAGGFGIRGIFSRRNGGYGIGQSRAQRLPRDPVTIIHSTHMNAGGGGGMMRMQTMGEGGRNVFREEMSRQDRLRV